MTRYRQRQMAERSGKLYIAGALFLNQANRSRQACVNYESSSDSICPLVELDLLIVVMSIFTTRRKTSVLYKKNMTEIYLRERYNNINMHM